MFFCLLGSWYCRQLLRFYDTANYVAVKLTREFIFIFIIPKYISGLALRLATTILLGTDFDISHVTKNLFRWLFITFYFNFVPSRKLLLLNIQSSLDFQMPIRTLDLLQMCKVLPTQIINYLLVAQKYKRIITKTLKSINLK